MFLFRLIPREERLFDLFERQAVNITEAARRLREMVFDSSDSPAKAAAIKELERSQARSSVSVPPCGCPRCAGAWRAGSCGPGS